MCSSFPSFCHFISPILPVSHSLFWISSAVIQFSVLTSSCSSNFVLGSRPISGVSESRKRLKSRDGEADCSCAAAVKRGPSPGSLEQYKSTNHPGQLTPSSSHIYTLPIHTWPHKDLRIASSEWKETSSAQTRLARLARLENRVCVLSMDGSFSWLKVLSHKRARCVPCMSTLMPTVRRECIHKHR